MTTFGRMLWLRNLDALANGDDGWHVEAEIGSELSIPGFLSYENHAIVFGRTTFAPDETGLYKYLLRLRQGVGRPIDFDVLKRASSRSGYVFRGGPAGELTALFSLTLQSRLFVLSTTERSIDPDHPPLKTEFAPARFRGNLQHQDGVLFSPSQDRNLSTSLPLILDAMRAIPARHHLELAVAADHYARAVRTVGIDEELVFVRLVSAIERVMGNYGRDALTQKVLGLDCFSEQERAELRTTLQSRHAGARFVTFLERYSKGFFEGEAREPAHTQVTLETLPAVAKAIYKARSAYLHNGDPMYLSLPMREFSSWHRDPSVGKLEQNRTFTSDQHLPRADFFHRLVRHCILGRIEELRTAALPH